jgi:epsilon-lactone hydrolase
MTTLNIPARDIPVPVSVSPEAQAVLSMGPLTADVPWPPLDDRQAWRELIKVQDEMVLSSLTARVAGVQAKPITRMVDGVNVHVVAPPDTDDDRIVLDLHGGALILMGGSACAAMTAIAAGGTRMATWGVDYRMPPDHPYPAALDDCLTVYRALLGERDSNRIVVVGGSAGGNLAAALVVRARDEGLPLPAAVVLNTPEVDLTESGDTFTTNLGVDTILSPLKVVNELYAAGHDLAHPYLSPLFADLTGFPPTILTSGTRDLFLSNTVRMHRALRRVGVEAELHVLEAAPHGGFLGAAPEDAEIGAEIRRFIDQHCPTSTGK